MSAYEATANYKLIYVYNAPYEDHAGLVKIGDTSLKTSASPAQLPPNCEMLNQAAHIRIRQEVQTYGGKYELLYTELAIRKIKFADGSQVLERFRDFDVNRVLSMSGYPAYKFYDGGKAKEWYPVSLQTAINAIRAVKEGRSVLTEAEKTEAERSETSIQNIQVNPPIELRDEQSEAIERTKRVFKRHDSMLWDCKMRFGKTISACSLVKEYGFKKTIVVTHRPVVADGWESDYHRVFGDSDKHVFQTKIKSGTEKEFDEYIDGENARSLRNLSKSGKSFMYFASLQDLRESIRIKPDGYKKNDIVFDMDWDLIIYDEAHEGTQTDPGQKVQKELEKSKNGKKPKVLSLSGTPYNIIGKYDDNVYSWDYVMEQKRKREWDEKYPGVSNPYADLPELRILTFDLRDSIPESYRYETEEMAFNFREFFRTWTGDPEQDHRPLPVNTEVGGFVHEADVIGFLKLITTESKDSFYPFSTHEYRDMFRHTFWMVPGVKAAAALTDLLRQHPVFKHYKIANVAGEGDKEKEYDDALKEVRAVIKSNPYTITISCGRLTTGVTVPEWTGVMMLAGTSNTSASGYMQTIFRVQSAGSIDGKQKELCYAFDFAPDRAIRVLSDVYNSRKKGGGSGDENPLGEFLNFCPVLAVDGTGMHEYDVPKLMRQIKRMTVDKAIKSGFDDESVYKNETGIVMDKKDVALFQKLGDILSRQKQTKTAKKIKINKQGLTNEEHEKLEKIKSKPKRQRTPEEEALLEKEKQQKKEREKVIQLLRNVSIRLPLLIYGADVDLTESIKMEDFVTLVDDESWKEFMPNGVTKVLFRSLLKYYDEDVIIGAGYRIRRMARAADELPPTQRVMRIAEIFSLFRNPDKETVLTPWRVVNMHMSDMLGGYCFYDETFNHPDGLLDEPRQVDQGDVSAAVLSNPAARILEMNSKSGLYPLYMAYSIYTTRLSGDDNTIPIEDTQQIWRDTIAQNVYVLCKTKMARQITRRTLVGYQDWQVNAIYLSKQIDRMQDMKRLANKLRNPATWGKEGEKMKFDAVVGNPPYQEMDGGSKASAVPVYQHFIRQGKNVQPRYLSMIIPAKWYSGGRNLDAFREEMITDHRFAKMVDFSNSQLLFPSVDIAGGLCYFLWDINHDDKCKFRNTDIGASLEKERFLDEYQLLIRNNDALSIIEKVMSKNEHTLASKVSRQRPFGLRTYAKPDVTGDYILRWSGGYGPVLPSRVTAGNDMIDKWKVMISYLTAEHAGQPDKEGKYRVLSTNEILPPKTICTETYLIVDTFEKKKHAENLLCYLKTRFVRFLILQIAVSQHLSQASFGFVPDQDFSRLLTDEELYKKYCLSEEEIRLIESMIKPMD